MSDAQHRPGHRVWHALREHATHWAIGGVLIAATGLAPEEWLARALDDLRIPGNALHQKARRGECRAGKVAGGQAAGGMPGLTAHRLRRRERAAPYTRRP
ncbi:MAG: hypothetical protein ABSC95_02050 [Acetobacteraceae bacterium]|jgi:hypothetical protein